FKGGGGDVVVWLVGLRRGGHLPPALRVRDDGGLAGLPAVIAAELAAAVQNALRGRQAGEPGQQPQQDGQQGGAAVGNGGSGEELVHEGRRRLVPAKGGLQAAAR